MSPTHLLFTIGLIAFAMPSVNAAPRTDGPPASTGYRNAALLGHSLLYPSAGVIDDMARFAGYSEHVGQYVEANTGPGGSAWKVWAEYFDANDALRPEKVGKGLVDEHIKRGGVELLVMTYFKNVKQAGELKQLHAALTAGAAARQAYIDREVALRVNAYRKWIDFTLVYNADNLRKASIMIPHIPYIKGISTRSLNRSIQDLTNETIRGIVDRLRVDYPALEITVIPAGDGTQAIWEQYEAGNLPEITRVMGENGVYRDSLHGSAIVYELSHLIWMASLYPESDIRTFDHLDKPQFRQVKGARNYNPAELFHAWSIDLRQLAWDIVQAEPYSGVSNTL